jgi:hypothetical protein
VYDNYFETVHSREDQELENWGELLPFGRFQSKYNEDNYGPELPDEWLNPQDLAERTNMQQQERDAIVKQHGGTADDDPVPIPVPNISPIQVAPMFIVPQPAPTVNVPQIVVQPPVPPRQAPPPPPFRNN